MKRKTSFLIYLQIFLFILFPLYGTNDELPTPSATSLPSHTSVSVANHILFLMHTGDTSKALQSYKTYTKDTGNQDFELLEQIGLILLDQGYRTNDPEIQLLTLFGSGISMNEKALYILEDGLTSNQPELQLIALNFLSQYQNDRADEIIHKAMKSNYLLVRLEAVIQLASKKDPKAVSQAEALMAKVDEEIWSIFPQIFAISGSTEATKMLRKLLANHQEGVRIEAIRGVAEHGRDDLLPIIRRLASHHGDAQQEACAAALGRLRDEGSFVRLEELAQSKAANVKLAALNALYHLGRKNVRTEIEAMANKKNPFAILLLGSMPNSESFLIPFLKNESMQIRVNAAMALLELRHPSCLPILGDLLIKDARDLAFLKMNSPGKSLSAFKVIPSSQQNLKDNPMEIEISLNQREAVLIDSMELPEKHLLFLANAIFENQENDLVPTLARAMENHPTSGVVELLKKHQQKAGAPLIRNYCNLILYKLREPGPYADNLYDWVTQQRNIDLIRFRPVLPWSFHNEIESSFQLTPQETSRLLVDAFEAFVSTQDEKAIDMLISIIQNGNAKNKYALIGLMMRAIQ